jgi:hypothetical protein
MGLFVNDSARGLIASLAMAGTLLLAGCLEEDRDPAASPDITSANYYAAALGNVAVQIQNAVTSQADWFENQSHSGELDLAALGIQLSGFTSPVKSSICFSGTGSEVIQLTWLDSRDATGKFGIKGTGAASGRLIAAMRERLGSEQLGTYVGTVAAIQMLSGQMLPIPPSCPNLRLPEGAPVIVYRIARPAPPTTELARTEYRSVPCGTDASGRERRGTMVQSRVVNFLPDGTITPNDRDTGWQTENMGQCIDDVVVEISNRSLEAGGAAAQLDNFADIALRALLEEALAMDCSRVGIDSNRMIDGHRTHRSKSIDTCRRATAHGADALSDTAAGDNSDVRNLCPRDTTDTRYLLGVTAGGLLRSVYAGTANVSRLVHSALLNKPATQEMQRERWVGQEINCSGTDDYTVSCDNVPKAPTEPDEAAVGSKWNYRDIAYYDDNLWWINEAFNFCFGIFGDCEYIDGGGSYLLNWNWFKSKQALHTPPQTVRTHRNLSASAWLDPNDSFTPDWNLPGDGTQGWVIASNSCLIRKRELQLACPNSYDASKQGSWDPYELSPTADFLTTLEPGGTYGGKSGEFYNRLRAEGSTPGLVWLNKRSCNIKGCSRSTESAGPGTNAYIQSWRYSEANSVNGAISSVQTIMMNKDGQQIDYTPKLLSGPKLEYVGKYSVPLHCGRIERRPIIWPMLVGYYVCHTSGGVLGIGGGTRCNWEYWPNFTTVTEVVTREWSGESAVNGTWSRPAVRYLSSYGTWTRIEHIPNPMIAFGGVVYM